jgi:ribonuclease HI
MDNVIEIYTDGSHFKHQGKFGGKGCGAYCLWQGINYELAFPVTKNTIKKYNIKEDFLDTISNPTAEFLAFAEVLSYFVSKDIRSNLSIRFCIDYIGIESWMSGKWKAKETYIILIRDACRKMLKNISAKVEIIYVPSKSNEGNLRADYLAKSGNNIDNFKDLISEIIC